MHICIANTVLATSNLKNWNSNLFKISSDIKTVLLIHLSQKATDGRLDWSGLKLENVTPQVRIDKSTAGKSYTGSRALS